MTFTTQTMQEIFLLLQKQFEVNNSISFIALNPDHFDEYSGFFTEVNGQAYIHRSYKAWTDLAELFICKIKTPKILNNHLVQINFVKLKTKSFHTDNKDIEKYGMNSHFSRIQKMEEPAFLYYYLQALQNVKLEQRKRILNLGVNRGDEFEVIRNLLDTNKYENIEFVGIDHSKTAIDYAKSHYQETNVTFYMKDINTIDTLKLGQFDLLISIGTLQSSNINFKPFFMSLVQDYLEKESAIILGFPNSRWIGGEILYGAKAPNYAMSEMSLVFNDLMFAKKYLQQKKFRVTITGKQYLFLTATKIGGKFNQEIKKNS